MRRLRDVGKIVFWDTHPCTPINSHVEHHSTRKKLLNYLRFVLPVDLAVASESHIEKVLKSPYFASLDLFGPLEPILAVWSCLLEVYPWNVAMRIASSIASALLVTEAGSRHVALAKSIQLGETRCCLSENMDLAEVEVKFDRTANAFFLHSRNSIFLVDALADMVLVRGDSTVFAVSLKGPGVMLSNESELQLFGAVGIQILSDIKSVKAFKSFRFTELCSLLKSLSALSHSVRFVSSRALKNQNSILENSTFQFHLTMAHALLFTLDVAKELLISAKSQIYLCAFNCYQNELIETSLSALFRFIRSPFHKELLTMSQDGSLHYANLVKLLLRQFEIRFSGIQGFLSWATRKIALYADAMSFFYLTSPARVCRIQFQKKLLKSIYFTLLCRIYEDFDEKAQARLCREICHVYFLLQSIRRSEELETHELSSEDHIETAACMRSLFFVSQLNLEFCIVQKLLSVSQVCAIDTAGDDLIKEALCNLHVLVSTARDPSLDVLNHWHSKL